MSRSLIGNLLKYVLAFGLLAYMVSLYWRPSSGPGLEYVWTSHVVEGKSVAFGYLALALALFSFSYLITFIRWYFLVRAQGMSFHFRDALRLGMYGVFASTFLPGSVGGDAVKAVALARGQKRRTVAVATVIMDRVIAVWAMIMMVAVLGGIFWFVGSLEDAGTAKRVVRVCGIIVGVSVVIWTLLGFLPQRRAEKFAGRLSRIPKAGHSLAELWRAVWMYRCRQKSVYLALGLTWLGQVGFVLGFYFSACTLYGPELGSIPDVGRHFLLVPIGLIAQGVPLFPGGVGIGEAAFERLYSWFGGTGLIGLLGSLMMRVVTWVCAVIAFLIARGMQPAPVPAVEQEPLPEPQPILKPACGTTTAS